MSFKWEEMLSQYVGRLHRICENKNEVRVFDYVDINVKMFANMFNVRLKGYKKLHYALIDGFKIGQNKLLYKNEYRNYLLKDIENCTKVTFTIIDYSPQKLSELIAYIKCDLKIINSENIYLQGANIDVNDKEAVDNSIIIDDRIVYYGGINPFAENMFDESIMRIDDRDFVDVSSKK